MQNTSSDQQLGGTTKPRGTCTGTHILPRQVAHSALALAQLPVALVIIMMIYIATGTVTIEPHVSIPYPTYRRT